MRVEELYSNRCCRTSLAASRYASEAPPAAWQAKQEPPQGDGTTGGRACGRIPREGKKGLRCQLRGASPQRRLERVIRRGRRDIERYRSRDAHSNGDRRARQTGVHRVPGALAGRAQVEAGGELCVACPCSAAEGGAVPGYAARHCDLQAGGMVILQIDSRLNCAHLEVTDPHPIETTSQELLN